MPNCTLYVIYRVFACTQTNQLSCHVNATECKQCCRLDICTCHPFLLLLPVPVRATWQQVGCPSLPSFHSLTTLPPFRSFMLCSHFLYHLHVECRVRCSRHISGHSCLYKGACRMCSMVIATFRDSHCHMNVYVCMCMCLQQEKAEQNQHVNWNVKTFDFKLLQEFPRTSISLPKLLCDLAITTRTTYYIILIFHMWYISLKSHSNNFPKWNSWHWFIAQIMPGKSNAAFHSCLRGVYFVAHTRTRNRINHLTYIWNRV